MGPTTDRNRRHVTLPAMLLTIALISSAQAAPLYTLHDLGTLPGESFSVAWGINASGQVVGWSGVSPNRAFLYKDGAGMVALPGLPGQTYTLARGINDAGVVVGAGWASGVQQQALRWTAGVPEALGVLEGSSEGWDINGAGVTIGSSPAPGTFVTHAFMHTNAGGMVDLTPNQVATATAYDVNDFGQVTGTFGESAYLWSPNTGLQILGSLAGYRFGNGRAVNDAGQVAGFAISASGNSSRFFRYTKGVGIVDLGGVGQDNVVWGMNGRGDVVGQGVPAPGGLKRAVLYTDALGLRALNDLIDASPRWFLLMATDINDAGQIVGYGLDNVSGLQKAFRLDPITPADVTGSPRLSAFDLALSTANPSRGDAGFVLTLGRAQAVGIAVYDVAGQRVATLHEGPLDAGPHAFSLAGRDLASGLYFLHATSDGHTATRRFTMLR